MYNLSRGPSKINTSTRRGISRGFELHENSRDQSERVDSEAAMSGADRAVFHHNHNGRMRHPNHHSHPNHHNHPNHHSHPNHHNHPNHQNPPRPSHRANNNSSSSSSRSQVNSPLSIPQDINPQHQEAASFLSDSWNKAIRDYTKNSSTEGGGEWYRPREPHPAYANFQGFNLEESRRMNRMSQSTS